MGSLLWPLWPWLSLRPMLGDTTDAGTDTATDAGTDTDMARGPLMLTPAPTLGVTDMAAHTDTDTAMVFMATTLMATDSPTPVTDTDTIMARGPLMPMPTTDTDTDTGADTLMASKLPPTWSPATAPPQ